MADEKTKLLKTNDVDNIVNLIDGPAKNSSSDFRTTSRRVVATLCAVLVVALGVLYTSAKYAATPSTGNGVMTNYVLRTRCIDDHIKNALPGFFRDGATITGAMIVRHNLGSDHFFDAYEEGLQMTPVTVDMTGYEWDWEEGRFFLETDQLDHEWGFAIVNTFGDVYYEIGSGADAPLWGQTCQDIIRRDSPTEQYFNRFIGQEPGNGNKIEYVFGGCNNTCPGKGFMEWSDEQRQLATRQVKENTPNEVGAEFNMFGYAGDGVCQFDILVPGQESATDQYSQNRILHWVPSDARNYVHTNARKDHRWSGEQNWPDGWPAEFGPVNDPSSRAEWRVRIVLKENTIESSACSSWSDDSTCVVKSDLPYAFGYSPSSISGVTASPAYADNFLRSDGNCNFYAKYPGPQKNPLY